jgi:hypothetical protein
MYHALFQKWLFWLSKYPWSVPYSWVLRNREMFHRTYRYNQLKKSGREHKKDQISESESNTSSYGRKIR